jgi:hypothetical protein
MNKVLVDIVGFKYIPFKEIKKYKIASVRIARRKICSVEGCGYKAKRLLEFEVEKSVYYLAYFCEKHLNKLKQ